MNFIAMILAQATPPAGPAPTTPAPSAGSMLVPVAMIAGLMVFMIMSSRSQKKREQRERDDMHSALSKNDRVLTIGGVVGTVITIKEEEIVLKVDETTNTKMTFVKTAIQRVLTDDKLTTDAR